MGQKTIEVSILFTGENATINSEAFMEYMDTIPGIAGIIGGITFHGGKVYHIDDDPEQNIIIIKG